MHLIDSDVLIWLTRRDERARERLAQIAATAMENGLTLLTGNARHFAAIAELKTEIFER